MIGINHTTQGVVPAVSESTGAEKILDKKDYWRYLLRYSEIVHESEFYYHIGEPTVAQGWLLHISVIPKDLPVLLERVLPDIVSQAPIKVIKNLDHHFKINAGTYGITKLGKVLTVFPATDQQALELAQLIFSRTEDLTGPEILTDSKLGAVLYTRYGAFTAVVRANVYGDKEKFMFDPTGNLIRELYTIPAQWPADRTNPFLTLLPTGDSAKPEKLFAGRYQLQELLKQDVRGHVFKAKRFGVGTIRSVVIKQGKKGMLSNSEGRDIKDRLNWEQRTLQFFRHKIKPPRVYEYFSNNDNAYLVMEMIKHSGDLQLEIFKALMNKPWFAVEIQERVRIIGYLQQVVSLVSIIHEKGFVHRDITGTNFLITSYKQFFWQKNKQVLVPFDFELTYNMNEQTPNPPYGLGTYGYMSPEQENDKSPSFQDDIYSIGALLTLLTGFEPIWIMEKDRRHLQKKLFFLLRDTELVKLILDCTGKVNERPTLTYIHQSLESYTKRLEQTNIEVESSRFLGYTLEDIMKVVEKGTETLSDSVFLNNGTWLSIYAQERDIDLYPDNTNTYTSLHRGAGGMLYYLHQLRSYGLAKVAISSTERTNWEYLLNTISNTTYESVPGLHYGSAGVAWTLSMGIRDQLIEEKDYFLPIIRSFLERENDSLDVIHGTAGQLLATMACMDLLGPEANLKPIAEKFVQQLLNAQQTDASWLFPSGKPEGGFEKITGFGYGIAGVIYVLLVYGSKHSDQLCLEAASKGLAYLSAVAINNPGNSVWKDSDLSENISGWWCKGAPGIALTYLKAYEVLEYNFYKETAKTALRMHQANEIYFNLSQCHGTSGLGEIYLEAHRILGEQEWLDRASWIKDVIMSLRMKSSTGGYYWFVENTGQQTADLMIGNSGVLHFLTRYYFSRETKFPLLT